MVNRPGTKILYLLLLISALLAGCKKENSPAEPQTDPQYGAKEEFFPLHEGNTWLYIDSASDWGDPLKFEGSYKVKITDRLTINYKGRDIEVYAWNIYLMNYYVPDDNEYYCRNDSDGVAYYGGRHYNYMLKDFDSNYILDRYLEYKYPLKKGDTWSSAAHASIRDSFYIADVNTRTCISEDELFKTGCGNFHCVVFHHKEKELFRDELDTYEYIAKGIGLVGRIRKSGDRIVDKRTLQVYTLY